MCQPRLEKCSHSSEQFNLQPSNLYACHPVPCQFSVSFQHYVIPEIELMDLDECFCEAVSIMITQSVHEIEQRGP